jgi:hypothetical protein
MCVSVNGIIRLIESVCLGPKVIPLSGAHCISIKVYPIYKERELPVFTIDLALCLGSNLAPESLLASSPSSNIKLSKFIPILN